MVDTKLEVITIPVSDIERAKRFYETLGWQLDADFKGDGWRAVQLTPPGSPCSIHLGTDVVPGSAVPARAPSGASERSRAGFMIRSTPAGFDLGPSPVGSI
jgi:catechol 2,3-dioxygenase-like lactoylglutathione lyase family enzyme